MTSEPLRQFTIHAQDGGVYAVDAADKNLVATLMAIALIDGRLVEEATGKSAGISIVLLSSKSDQQELWNAVVETSWPLLHAACVSIEVVCRPTEPCLVDSQYRIQKIAAEAARRSRSQRFETLAAATAN